jgi:4-hydroxyphenylacetate 3-hydroxylase, reductase component
MGVDSTRFRAAMAQFATGVTIVTTRDEAGHRFGLTVNAFASVSLEPPLVLVCIDNRSDAHRGFHASGVFGISVLAEGQEEWSRRFATPGPEKWTGATFETGAAGVALIPGALAHVECRVAAAHPAGDHTIYVGQVASLTATPGRPLLYHGSAYGRVEARAKGE